MRLHISLIYEWSVGVLDWGIIKIMGSILRKIDEFKFRSWELRSKLVLVKNAGVKCLSVNKIITSGLPILKIHETGDFDKITDVDIIKQSFEEDGSEMYLTPIENLVLGFQMKGSRVMRIVSRAPNHYLTNRVRFSNKSTFLNKLPAPNNTTLKIYSLK